MAGKCSIIDLGPPCWDLTGVRAGDRNAIACALTTGGAPMNLAGYVVHAHARKTKLDAQPALVAEVDWNEKEKGTFWLRWPGEEVRTLLAGEEKWTGFWDLQIVPGRGDATTVAAGKFTAETDVTR